MFISSLVVFILTILNQSSCFQPVDRTYFPGNRENPDNGLSDHNASASGPPHILVDYIRSSEIVHFPGHSRPNVKRDGNVTLSSQTFLGKQIECNEKTVNNLFPIVSIIRHHENEPEKDIARKRILDHYQKYGLETFGQRFTTKSGLNGMNLIGIWPGRARNKTSQDKIILLGGHYDTVKGTQGIDDNGSGVVALLELVRLIGSSKPLLDHSIFFVAFDFEESGLWGSKAFVSQYLIPEELIGKRATFLGAYIMDMILTYDSSEGSQNFGNDFKKETPEAVLKVRKNKSRGDFASIWMRRDYDRAIYEPLEASWSSLGNDKFKIIPFDVILPDKTSVRSKDIRESARTFLRSDHSSFWYHGNRKVQPLPALLITDLGPWRGYQKSCYHKSCDNLSQLTEEKLGFMVHIILALHGVITNNPPKSTVTLKPESSSSPVSPGLPRKWLTVYTPDRYSPDSRTKYSSPGPYYIDSRDLIASRGGDIPLDSRFQPPLSSSSEFWPINPYKPSKPWLSRPSSPFSPTFSPFSSSPSSSSSASSSSLSPLPSISSSVDYNGLRSFQPRNRPNPWYTLIRRSHL